MSRTGLGFGLLCLLPASAAVADGGAEVPAGACSPTVDQQLTQLKIDRADLTRIVISPEYSQRDDDNRRLTGQKAWIELKSCRGYLIIDMQTDCRVRQVYTRGSCSVPGVRAF